MWTENYKRVPVTLYFNEKTKKFYASSEIIKEDAYEEFDSPYDALNKIQSRIDTLLKDIPLSWVELGEKIQDTLVWVDHETWYVDANIVKKLVEQFLQYKQYKQED